MAQCRWEALPAASPLLAVPLWGEHCVPSPPTATGTWLSAACHRRGNAILLLTSSLLENNFCGSDAAAAGSFAKNLSSCTGNEAPFKSTRVFLYI